MSMQLQSTFTVLSVSLEETEPLRAIKNEPLESQIGIDDIPNSLDEEISPDIKDIDIISHVLSEHLIKSETVCENTFENNHSESVETHGFVKTENTPYIKTEDTSDENVSRSTSQGVIEVQECYKTDETTSCEKDTKKAKVIEVPVIPIEPHKYTSLAKTKHACRKNKSTHKQNKKRYCCEKCPFISENHSHFKRHKLSHKTKAEVNGRNLKYCCDKCNYKTFRHHNFKRHKLMHLKPEQIPYVYCYHCPYKCKQKSCLKTHIFNHFKKEEVSFHCYICYFTTVKRSLIIEHFKKHPKHRSKCDETDYKNHLETYTMRYCKKCSYKTYNYEKLKLHELTHETEAKLDDRHFKYRCDKCKYKTFRCDVFKTHKLTHLKPEDIQYFYCYHCSYKSNRKQNLKEHIFLHFKYEEIPFYCHFCDFVTLERDLIIEHFKTHPKHHSKCDETDYKNQLENYTKKQLRYCKKCSYKSYNYGRFKLHELTHETEAKMDDRHFKYRCDKCKYRTSRHQDFKRHKLIHLKPEEIQYFYCYHCSHKSKCKQSLKVHIFLHFKYEEIPFYCHFCDFVTLERDLIIEHFKTHVKHHNECDETEYRNQLVRFYKIL